MNKWKVYVHVNKINGKIYIGITMREPSDRWINGYGYRRQAFYSAIKKYGWGGFEHIILFENLEKELAEEIEKFLIKKYKSNEESNGYNIAYGGLANPGHKLNDETKRKISAYQRSTKRKLLMSEQTKRKISNAMRHKSCKIVYQYGLDGSFIRTWESASDAARCCNYEHSQISACCVLRQKTAFGYIWSYAELSNAEYEKRIKKENVKVTENDIYMMNILYKEKNMSYREIGKIFGVDKCTVRRKLMTDENCNSWQ